MPCLLLLTLGCVIIVLHTALKRQSDNSHKSLLVIGKRIYTVVIATFKSALYCKVSTQTVRDPIILQVANVNYFTPTYSRFCNSHRL